MFSKRQQGLSEPDKPFPDWLWARQRVEAFERNLGYAYIERNIDMSGSGFGKCFSVSTWGESHGEGLGCVVDGCPAGVPLALLDIQSELDRRKPGGEFATSRQEADKAMLLSGVFEGATTGTPISIALFNSGQRSSDYKDLCGVYRPGHADLAYDLKYGVRDYRGGGRSSGRETAGRVAAGAVAKAFLRELGITVSSYVASIGSACVDKHRLDLEEASRNPLRMPDAIAYKEASELCKQAIKDGDSLGGIVECFIRGVISGLGEPVFDKAHAVLGHAFFSIGAVKGVEFGRGFESASLKGSECNDGYAGADGRIAKLSNNAGGFLGGITDGSDIFARIAFKPTPSISKEQRAANSNGESVSLSVRGRHDPVIPPRASVVVEAMAAIALADLAVQSLASKVSDVKSVLGARPSSFLQEL
jgi:chorismate synthase